MRSIPPALRLAAHSIKLWFAKIPICFRIVAENPTWRAPRIHGELRMLGFDLSERTVLRWMQKAPRTRSRQTNGWPF